MNVMPEPADEWSELLRAANNGDAAAYATFLRAVMPVLRGVVQARGQGLPQHAHEDIVQEVLIAIHRKRHAWQDDRPVRPWLYAIARYKVVDAFRARGRAIHLPIGDFDEVLEAAPAEDGLAKRDIEHLMTGLDRRSADIVRGVSLEEEPTAIVGARLGMSEGAVRVALHRALKRLAVLAGRKQD